MLSAAAELATAQAGGDSVCFASATLEAGAGALARSLRTTCGSRGSFARRPGYGRRLLTDATHGATGDA